MKLCVISLLAASLFADSVKDSSKLNFDQRVEIVRGLMAEFATVKTFLPRSKKPLPFQAVQRYGRHGHHRPYLRRQRQRNDGQAASIHR